MKHIILAYGLRQVGEKTKLSKIAITSGYSSLLLVTPAFSVKGFYLIILVPCIITVRDGFGPGTTPKCGEVGLQDVCRTIGRFSTLTVKFVGKG
jgi:hypothetical protein